MKLMSGEKRNL